jgi:hypothetical protein
MLVLDRISKLEGVVAEQGTVLGRIQDVTSQLEPVNDANSRLLGHLTNMPAQARRENRMFRLPKDCWASLDHFLSLPFVRELLPMTQTPSALVCDSAETRRIYELPNLQKEQVHRLVQCYTDAIHVVYSVLETATLERLQQRLEEDGLGWTGEDAITLQVLALGAMSCGETEDANVYMQSANRRLGIAGDKVDILAIQAAFLQGYSPEVTLLTKIILASQLSTSPSRKIFS